MDTVLYARDLMSVNELANVNKYHGLVMGHCICMITIYADHQPIKKATIFISLEYMN